MNNQSQIIGQQKMNMGWNQQDSLSAFSQSMDMASTSASSLFSGMQQHEMKKFDVLKAYDSIDSINNQSILTGGLDIGIDIGKFTIDNK